RNLILSRKLGPDENVRVTDISGSLLYSPHPSYYESDTGELGDNPDDKIFEIVKPGASVERDFAIVLPVSKDSSHRVGSAPAPGNYLVWASRSTWPFYSDETRANRMRVQWTRHGFLVTRPVRVEGIKVQTSLPKQLPACDGSVPRAGNDR